MTITNKGGKTDVHAAFRSQILVFPSLRTVQHQQIEAASRKSGVSILDLSLLGSFWTLKCSSSCTIIPQSSYDIHVHPLVAVSFLSFYLLSCTSRILSPLAFTP